jgi:nitronate monooxygenase
VTEPAIIQGGMGVGVSNWRLARAVSRMGQLGVVSGTALDAILARRLQDGDKGGHMRRALARFPVPEIAQRILDRYFLAEGRPPHKPYRAVPMFTLHPSAELLELAVAANFVEVDLAKHGHAGLVGINLLEKIQMHSPAALYGAMLAGVDYVLMGAGIPRAIPAVMDQLTTHQPISIQAHTGGAVADDSFRIHFDPRQVMKRELPPLARPKFVAIVASNVLALTLVKKASGRVDGFVIEGPTAGGHNAPPRGEKTFNERGEPVYGQKDEVNLDQIRKLGLPFWVAGGCAEPEQLKDLLARGAAGIQVGTAFAYCRESGMADWIKTVVLQKAKALKTSVFTDPLASPTGFPFKVVELEGTLSEDNDYRERIRVCNLGYLRIPCKTADGTPAYRCAGEPEEQFLRKGGEADMTEGRKCLCNGLMANIGLPQSYASGYLEKALVTSGDDVKNVHRFLTGERTSYSAADVVRNLLGLMKPPRLSTAMA